MFNRLQGWLFDVLLKRYALGWLVVIWNHADGYRTQVSVLVSCGVLTMGLFGFIEMNKAYEIALMLGGTSIATFLEKLRKYDGMIVKISDLVKDARVPAPPSAPTVI